MLIDDLGKNIHSLQDGPVQIEAGLSDLASLKEIHDVLGSIKDNVGTISTTLSAIAEEG